MSQSSSSALHLLDRHRLLLHLGLPAGVALLLVAAFFSGAPWLTRAVVPARAETVGVPDLLQIATLALAAWVSWRAARSARGRRGARWAFAALAAATVVLLLGELDYGRQLYDLLTDVPPAARAAPAAAAAPAMAWTGLDRWLLLALAVLFAAAAASRLVRAPWGAALRRLAPSGWHAVTLAVLLGTTALVRVLGEMDGTTDVVLARLLGALRELGLFYVGALLVLEAAARRGLSPAMRFRLPPALVVSTARRRRPAAAPAPDGPPRLVVLRGGAAEPPAAHRPTPGRAARSPAAPAAAAPTAASRTTTSGMAGRVTAWTARTPHDAGALAAPPRATPRPARRPAPSTGAAVTPLAGRRRWLRPMLPGSGGDGDADGQPAEPHGPASPTGRTESGPTHGSPAR